MQTATLPTEAECKLEILLQEFRVRVNVKNRLAFLLKGWEPTLVVETTDTGEIFSLPVRNQAIESVKAAYEQASHEIHIRGTTEILALVFSGKKNPAIAFMQGDLEVVGSTQDQVKLDAICLVVWGIC
jgi:hypothetical protein